jgi:hypothetical protein
MTTPSSTQRFIAPPVSLSTPLPAPEQSAPVRSATPVLHAEVFIGLVRIEVRAPDIQELIRQISQFDQLPATCGHCGGLDLAPRHRRVREFEFFSLHCSSCHWTLPLGRRRDGGLFPRLAKGWQPPWEANT